MKKKIFILSANPKGTGRLRLDEEVREVEEGLRRAKLRDQFEIKAKWAIRFGDIRRALLEFEPHIVHFAGHGGKNGLMLEGKLGFTESVSSKALSGLFELCSGHVECVILNACYTEPQAEAISRHINYVIGMKNAIRDKASTEFAVGFYDALGAGKSVDDAFKFGRNAILNLFPDLKEHLIPILKKRLEAKESIGTDAQAIPTKRSLGKFNKTWLFFFAVLILIIPIYYFSSNKKIKKINESDLGVVLEEKIEMVGQLMIQNLDRTITGFTDSDWEKYNIAGRRLYILFLFNRGPDINLGKFSDPLNRRIYKRIVKVARKNIQKKQGLRSHVSILKINLDKCNEISREGWLKSEDRYQIGLTGRENAVYEIVLNVDWVTGKIHIGGKLFIGFGEGGIPVPKAFTPPCPISVTDQFRREYRPSDL